MAESDDTSHTKEEMRKFIKADRKMRREATRNRSSGCLMTLLKINLFVLVLCGAAYGIYLWHPWGYESSSTERESMDACPDRGRGYESVTRLVVLGVTVRETKSSICVD